jgi:3-hydroxybutyryl-CoA dehydratase
MLASRCIDDFHVGDRVVTRARTIDQSDISAFAGLTWDFYPLHTDEQFARTTRFGGRIAHGPLVYAVAVGLMPIDWFGDAIVAFMGVDRLRHLAPVYPGSTLHVEAEVISVDPRDGGGVVVVRYDVIDETASKVLTAEMRFLIRGADQASAPNSQEVQ